MGDITIHKSDEREPLPLGKCNTHRKNENRMYRDFVSLTSSYINYDMPAMGAFNLFVIMMTIMVMNMIINVRSFNNGDH